MGRTTFVDEAELEIIAGKGGDGCVSFRREKYVPKGGPDGGRGGDGGSVYFVADPHLHTLLDFQYRHRFQAGAGVKGGTADRTGARGEDCSIPVPLGTQVYDADTGELLADLVAPGQRLLAARGGTGGKGNISFATATRQAPRYAELGLPGERRRVRLVLKLLADVGLIGLPNAGKSTLISRVSAARPKIAAYPFTTLEPNLGSVKAGERSFVLADLPGLIEGAHEGVGLGHQFLRHIERTRVLIHLLDAGAPGRDLLEDLDVVNRELKFYRDDLIELPQLVAVNKIDLTGAREKAEEAAEALRGRGLEVHLVSAATGEGLEGLMRRCLQLLDQFLLPITAEDVPMLLEVPPPPEVPLSVEKIAEDEFVVRGTRVEREVAKTNLGSREALLWLHERLTQLRVIAALEAAGAREGDTVRIGDTELEYVP
ncbi:MAG: GTPase ObgE [Armatimonadota bacterium]